MDKSKKVLYVGKAKSLKLRVSSYFSNRSHLGNRTSLLLSQSRWIRIILVDSEIESLLLEANLIKKYNPKFNSRLTDGKAYPLIRITINTVYPSVVVARKSDDASSVYFGPFPNAMKVRTVLRLVRRIFPFQSVLNHPKRICLYNHLGLCPCPPLHVTDGQKKSYQKNINHLVQFLEGKKKTVLKELEKERNTAAKNQEFESAQEIQKQINSILYITRQFHKPFEYETNPSLTSDLREKELNELQKILNQNGVNVTKPNRIECYDISNIQGINAVASMVVFTQGEKDSSQYRRFKIRYLPLTPNDFAMMEETITRRFKHDEWTQPELIIVDGGKGQITSGRKALEKSQSQIPLIGLAKREEIIITSDFKEIRLLKSSPALQLVQRLRDEAHRFAITYHKKLRQKQFLNR